MQDGIHEAREASADAFAADPASPLDENRIASLLVADEDNNLMGTMNFHGLICEGLM